jgi:hypothetical protein
MQHTTPAIQGLIPGRAKGILLFSNKSRAVWPILPPVQCVPAALSPGVKQPVHEVNHSPPSSTKVMNEWTYTSTLPPYTFIAWTEATALFLKYVLAEDHTHKTCGIMKNSTHVHTQKAGNSLTASMPSVGSQDSKCHSCHHTYDVDNGTVICMGH